jgi:hypothetical protein
LVKVGSLSSETKRVEVPVGAGGEKVGVVYRPGLLTPNSVGRMLDKDAEEIEVRKLLEEVLVSWEIEQNDGTDLPTTVEAMGDLPLGFLGDVITEMIRGSAVPEGNGGASSAT